MEHFKYVWQNTFNYEGRATRSEYWYFILYNIVVYALLWGLSFIDASLVIVPMIYILVSYLPTFSVTARRLHDVNKSGWFQLISFIPVIGAIWLLILMVRKGDAGDNKFGKDPLAKMS
jgi:uncharacterized membrane protein YhaH (DUF805 family)